MSTEKDLKIVRVAASLCHISMTKLLDQAIARVRGLPDADQDEAAEVLLWTLETRNAPLPLDDAARVAIDEGLAQSRRGELATDVEIAALWERHGL
jgi:hypothetical protein